MADQEKYATDEDKVSLIQISIQVKLKASCVRDQISLSTIPLSKCAAHQTCSCTLIIISLQSRPIMELIFTIRDISRIMSSYTESYPTIRCFILRV